MSSPKCRQLYNIFHPSDPVSYRIEPLVSSAMSALRPQPLPSVKRNLWIASGQSLSNIGNRVGQSVGTMLANLSSGVAGSFHRSLGLHPDYVLDDIPPTTDGERRQWSAPRGHASASSQSTAFRPHLDDCPETLIEQDLETLLHGGAQETRSAQRPGTCHSSEREGSTEPQEDEERVKRLRSEDAKVRRLNKNGRIDYTVQA